MNSYVNNQKFSDVTLILDGDCKMYGHKIILSRIPYFDTVFNSGMKESFEKEIEITHISSKVMLIILKYVYAFEFCFEASELNDLIPLYEACQYLGLDTLSSLCEEEILIKASIDNSCHILMKADEFNSIIMKEKILKFIIDNFVEVSLTSTFSDLLDNKELSLEVIRGYSSLHSSNLSKLGASFSQSNNSLN